MDTRQLKLIRPDRKKHFEELVELISKSFGGHDYWEFLAGFRTEMEPANHYDWLASTIGVLGAQIVTNWGIFGYRMRIGRAIISMAGVTAVATHGQFRKRGLMARTAREGIEVTRQCGYDMTLLFGITDFYGQFGFVSAWPNQKYVVQTKRLPKEAPADKFRKFAVRHRDDLVKLFNRDRRDLTGTAVRPTFIKRRSKLDGYLWEDSQNRPAGYVIIRSKDGQMECVEAVGNAEQTLRVMGRLARRRGVSEVTFDSLHHESELARMLRRRMCRLNVHYCNNGGAMIRTLNLATTLGKLTDEFARRLKHSHLADWRGLLLITDAREKVALRINRSKVTVSQPEKTRHAIRGGDDIARLLIGSDQPGEIIESGRMRLSGDAGKLIEVICPVRHPQLDVRDSF